MNARKIVDGVYWMGAVDWHRRLFDSLIPLPDGTSYNAYLVQGQTHTALIDTADPTMQRELLGQLELVPRLDYVVANHAEQDHSGLIPCLLAKYPSAMLVTSAKGKPLIMDHLGVPDSRIRIVNDGDTLALGGKTLEFVYTPWVHWPETMVTYLREDHILFSCDLFGSHLAASNLYVTDEGRVYEAAKRYYAEIMMPFRAVIRKNLDKLEPFAIERIAPSHGPVYGHPAFIINAYRDWASDTPKNEVVLPYISMHGSTGIMVNRMVGALAGKGVRVTPFNLEVTDIGKLAMSLVDAATLVVGTPTVHVGAHPAVFYAAHLANVLRPKLKFAAIIGSYGWSSKAAEQIADLIPNLKVAVLGSVIARGLPQPADMAALDALAETIAGKHRELNLL
ncbi:MAG: FprA family A-type flavoprotein [Kiritimatiellae bacterium]|nr:FprA family A-type flavoprotein [Kiritimatiellia bacterium]